MSDVRDLYQEVILDHNRRPRNRGTIEQASHRADGHNPVCGDRIEVSLQLDGEVVRELRFDGSGCAICMASSSLMTEAATGRPTGEVEELFHAVHGMLTGDRPASEALGKLRVLEGVRDYPMRVKCATLPWHTLRAALAKDGQGAVTTE
jgi:nitrogen fixation NifU-like protein